MKYGLIIVGLVCLAFCQVSFVQKPKADTTVVLEQSVITGNAQSIDI